MSAGTLIFLLLIGGSLFAMFAMHRGGSHGVGGGCMGGHSHGTPQDRSRADEPQQAEPTAGPAGQDDHDQPAPGGRHRGC